MSYDIGNFAKRPWRSELQKSVRNKYFCNRIFTSIGIYGGQLGIAITLSAFSLYFQVASLGFSYINSGNQWTRHEAVINGTAEAPWQYRVLSEWLIELYKALASRIYPINFFEVCVQFRLIQNILIFSLAGHWWKILGINLLGRILGQTILAFAFTQALYDSDLSFNTYSDLIFYLLGAIFLSREKSFYFATLIFFAALNRETCAFLIVVQALIYIFRGQALKKLILDIGLSTLAFGIPFIFLRVYYAEQPYMVTYGKLPGIEMVRHNLTNLSTYLTLFLTLGFTPLTGFLSTFYLRKDHIAWFWGIVPVWFPLHFIFGIAAETRLFLVPLTMAFIPLTLLGVQKGRDHCDQLPQTNS